MGEVHPLQAPPPPQTPAQIALSYLVARGLPQDKLGFLEDLALAFSSKHTIDREVRKLTWQGDALLLPHVRWDQIDPPSYLQALLLKEEKGVWCKDLRAYNKTSGKYRDKQLPSKEHTGLEKSGAFYPLCTLEELQSAQTFWICEGFATGCALRVLLEMAGVEGVVLCGIDAFNLKNVIPPHAKKVRFFADIDGSNTGQHQAVEAAKIARSQGIKDVRVIFHAKPISTQAAKDREIWKILSKEEQAHLPKPPKVGLDALDLFEGGQLTSPETLELLREDAKLHRHGKINISAPKAVLAQYRELRDFNPRRCLLDRISEKPRRQSLNAPSRYLERLEKREGITAVQASLGTGKTEIAKALCEKWSKGLWLAHRVALTRNTEERLEELGFAHYQDTEGPITAARSIVCIDSIERVENVPELVVIDEADQVLQSLIKAAKNGQTASVLKKIIRLKAILERAQQIVLLSADLDDHTLAAFTLLAERGLGKMKMKKIKKIIHLWEDPEQAWRFFKESSSWLERVKNAWLEGERLAIFCASREEAKEKAAWLQGLRPKAKLACVHREATDRDRETLRAVNARWSELDAVLFTSSAGSGVSFDLKDHFDRVCVWGRYAPRDLMASEYLQGAARIRHPKSREVWAFLEGKDKAPRSREEIAQHLQAKEKATLEILRSFGELETNAEGKFVPSATEPLAAEILLLALTQRDERSAAPLRWVLETLYSRGIKIITDNSKVSSKKIAKLKKELEKVEASVEFERVNELLKAPDLTPKQAEGMQSIELKRADQLALEHHQIASFYAVSQEEDQAPPRASAQLIEVDQKGRKRRQIKRLITALLFEKDPGYFADLDRKDVLEDPAERDVMKRRQVRSFVDAKHHYLHAKLLCDLFGVLVAAHPELLDSIGKGLRTSSSDLEQEQGLEEVATQETGLPNQVASQKSRSLCELFASLTGHFPEETFSVEKAIEKLKEGGEARLGELRIKGFELDGLESKVVGDIAAYFGIKRKMKREQVAGVRTRTYSIDLEAWKELLILSAGEISRQVGRLKRWQEERERFASLLSEHRESKEEQELEEVATQETDLPKQVASQQSRSLCQPFASLTGHFSKTPRKVEKTTCFEEGDSMYEWEDQIPWEETLDFEEGPDKFGG